MEEVLIREEVKTITPTLTSLKPPILENTLTLWHQHQKIL